MTSIALTAYVLIWPVAVAGILFVLTKAFFKDWIEARREGRSLV